MGMVFSHPRLLETLTARAAFLSRVAHSPMVVPPLPWRAFIGDGP
jgi:DNA-directed RNA polymerase, mitochondrial